jgi:hypothetical protein
MLLKDCTLIDYYEDVAMPALALAQADVSRDVLSSDRLTAMSAAVERVVEDLADHVDSGAPASADAVDAEKQGEAVAETRAKALCLAGRTMLDQAGCAILAQLLAREGLSASYAGPDSLTTRGIFALDATGVDAIFILYFDHRSMAPVRYSVRRLRKKFPAILVIVCLWGAANLKPLSEATGADATVSTLRSALAAFDRDARSPAAPVESRARPAAVA